VFFSQRAIEERRRPYTPVPDPAPDLLIHAERIPSAEESARAKLGSDVMRIVMCSLSSEIVEE
jgi:hypothetical protein